MRNKAARQTLYSRGLLSFAERTNERSAQKVEFPCCPLGVIRLTRQDRSRGDRPSGQPSIKCSSNVAILPSALGLSITSLRSNGKGPPLSPMLPYLQHPILPTHGFPHIHAQKGSIWPTKSGNWRRGEMSKKLAGDVDIHRPVCQQACPISFSTRRMLHYFFSLYFLCPIKC